MILINYWLNFKQVHQRSSILEELTEISKTFPNDADLLGAVRGLVFLHDTYHFDVGDLTEGIVRYRTLNGLKRALVGKEKLQLDDIFVLAGQVLCFKVLNLNRTFDKWDHFGGKDISD